MKVHIEIDCSPEEARRFMGLPDVEKANEVYVENIAKAMRGVSDVEQLQTYAKQLAPMAELGTKLFQNFMQGGGLGEADGKGPKDAPGDKDEGKPRK